MAAGVLPSGHRRRGAGLTLDQIPELERAIVFSRQKGRTVYVDSGVTTSGTGDSWSGAYSTLAAALSAALADDTILVAAGHAEAVTATNLACSKARVSVVGLGRGASRPTFTYGAAAATITVSAAGVTFCNLHFIANFAAVVTAFTITTAKDFSVTDCSFIDAGTSLNFLALITTNATANAADGLEFSNNRVIGLAATDGPCVSILAVLQRLRINDNLIDKLCTNDAGHLVTFSTFAVTGVEIMRNNLTFNALSNQSTGTLITGSSTACSGMVSDNRTYQIDTSTALTATAGTKLGFNENYMTGAADLSGSIYPAVDNPA